ncbi:hypothetical protein [Lysobacter enzymogenes]|uniref:hypothetical protein n=1 Tax=Lysobacter enzymogenes TaxID=69 RepID=UPI001AFCAB7A|nr:hypothetical protein [Lysobacter enzymogenes]QQQ00946.1 hypothetical protein JHW41_23245 [Lysobacter enzymogenes]
MDENRSRLLFLRRSALYGAVDFVWSWVTCVTTSYRWIDTAMATRYSKRRSDGTVAYYDSEEAMRADEPAPRGLFDFSIFYAVVGLFLSVVVVLSLVYGLDLGAGWPKPVRFSAMVIAVAAGSYVIGRTGLFLFGMFWLLVAALFVLGILGSIGAALWHFA